MNTEVRMPCGGRSTCRHSSGRTPSAWRAELKRRVAIGEITAADVILGAPWEAESMTVSDLLTSSAAGATHAVAVPSVRPDVREQDRRSDDRSSASHADQGSAVGPLAEAAMRSGDFPGRAQPARSPSRIPRHPSRSCRPSCWH